MNGMNRCMLVFLTALGPVLGLQVSASADVVTSPASPSNPRTGVREVDRLYRTQKAEACSQYDAETKRVTEAYLGELKGLEDKFTQDGNLDGVLAVRAEAKRFKVDKVFAPEEISGIEDIARVQEKHQALYEDARNQRNKRMDQLLKDYISSLKDIRTGLTRVNRTADAVIVDKEIKRLEAGGGVQVAAPSSGGAMVPEPPNCPAMPTKGLILYYSFDRDDGNTITDKSGKLRSTLLKGAKWVAQGKVGGCYEFDGEDDRITFLDTGFPAGNAPRTVSLWMKVGRFLHEPANYVFAYGTTRLGKAFALDPGSSSHNFRIVFWPDCGDTGYKPPIGIWQNILVTHDGNTVCLYVNGVFVWKKNQIFATRLSGTGTLGTWSRGDTAYHFNGHIDEVMVFDRALSAEEVATIYKVQGGVVAKGAD